ncbi:MAG TPA: hypothetical protein VGL66_15205 [Caulobacteraceae bacterium]|jgi:hypothetical protein
MTTDYETLADFIRRYRNAFGVDLTEAEARELSDRLLHLYQSVAIRRRPPPPGLDPSPTCGIS